MENIKTAVRTLWKSPDGATFSETASKADKKLLCSIGDRLVSSDNVLWLDSHGPDGKTERRIRLLQGKEASGIVQKAISKAVKIEDWYFFQSHSLLQSLQHWCNGRGLRITSFCENTKQVLTVWTEPTDERQLVLSDGTYKLNDLSGFFLTDQAFRYELKDGHSVTVSLADATHCQNPDVIAFASLVLAVQLKAFLSAENCPEFNLANEISLSLSLMRRQKSGF